MLCPAKAGAILAEVPALENSDSDLSEGAAIWVPLNSPPALSIGNVDLCFVAVGFAKLLAVLSIKKADFGISANANAGGFTNTLLVFAARNTAF
jgi:hypothetical protein